MASTWSSGSALPSYYSNAQSKDETSSGDFTFVDFLPDVTKPGGIFTQAKYDDFRVLVDRANDWLRANPQWSIVTCESIELSSRKSNIDSEKMTYVEYGESSTWYYRGLRLWLKGGNLQEKVTSQQIGYMNLVPQAINGGGIFSSPDFESLNDVITKFNNMSQPIPGRILNVESQEMKMKGSKQVDPDKSNWTELGDVIKHYIFVIRIFYELSNGTPEEIGICDFVPEMTKQGKIFTLPEYEPFSNLVKKASDWCAQQSGINVCNLQSLEIKTSSRKGDINTQKMNFYESGSMSTFYVRILRVAFTRERTQFYNTSSAPITFKTFVPVQLTSGLFLPEFETLQETKNRIAAWVKATGVDVLCAQTSAIRIFTGGEAKYGTEATFTYNRAETSEYFIFIIRLFFNGYFQEPPSEMLPPVPEIEASSCCEIL